MSSIKYVEVAVGAVIRDDTVFLTRRAEGVHQGGKWEFPGGKREVSESITDALKRELKEEIGIEVTAFAPLLQVYHQYPDKSVLLDVFLVTEFKHQPESKEGLESQWLSIHQLQDIDFPEANQAIVNKLLDYHS